jgi:hypothetical protein
LSKLSQADDPLADFRVFAGGRCSLLAFQFPICLDGNLLLEGFKCQNSYPLNMTLIRNGVASAQSGGGANQSVGGVATSSRTNWKARFVTPFNRLVGALVVSQRRVSGETCTAANSNVQSYSDSGQGLKCRLGAPDSRPFGVDPAFTILSELYAGDLAVEDWYHATERSFGSNGKPGTPYGFFPAKYKAANVTLATGVNYSSEIPDSDGVFRLYFDERIQYDQAKKLLTYLVDGHFLDDQTKEVSVEMNTLNIQLNMFATFVFTFRFQVVNNFLKKNQKSQLPNPHRSLLHCLNCARSIKKKLVPRICICVWAHFGTGLLMLHFYVFCVSG